MNLKLESVMVVSHAYLKVKAALDGLGISWLPKAMVESEIENEKLGYALFRLLYVLSKSLRIFAIISAIG